MHGVHFAKLYGLSVTHEACQHLLVQRSKTDLQALPEGDGCSLSLCEQHRKEGWCVLGIEPAWARRLLIN
jgi:hypothetical protein